MKVVSCIKIIWTSRTYTPSNLFQIGIVSLIFYLINYEDSAFRWIRCKNVRQIHIGEETNSISWRADFLSQLCRNFDLGKNCWHSSYIAGVIMTIRVNRFQTKSFLFKLRVISKFKTKKFVPERSPFPDVWGQCKCERQMVEPSRMLSIVATLEFCNKKKQCLTVVYQQRKLQTNHFNS